MRLPGRFEWKILGAMVLASALTVGLAAYALRFALYRFASYAIHHQADIGGSSAQADKVFRAYFEERKREFRHRTEQIAASNPTEMEQLADVEWLMRARLFEGEAVIGQWETPPEIRGQYRDAKPIRAKVNPDAQGEEANRSIELTFGIPVDMYDNWKDLQTAIDRERGLDQAFDAWVPRFVQQYAFFIACILPLPPLLVLLVTRRATRKVARLRQAARRVGAGDLKVRVEPTGKDELDDLGRAFDRMVAELGEARSRLEYLQKVSAWQEVARRLAHEIKNPLTPVQLAVQELVTQYKGDDVSYRRLLETVTEILREEITGLRRLVDDFSAFAKLQKVDPAPLDLVGLVADFARTHPEWAGLLLVQPAPGPVIAPCDKTLFRRVLFNLVENAVQAAEGIGKSPRVHISVEARRDRGRAAVVIDDNGPGVPEDNRQRIFDPYVTNKDGGTGLGLAIVRKIAIDHGGDISVSSAPPPLLGARFQVEIPS